MNDRRPASMRPRWIFFAIILAGALGHPAGAKEPPTEEQLERLVQRSPKVHLPNLIALTEGKLERAYQARLQAATDPAYREALRKAQEAWKKFYAADQVAGAFETAGVVVQRAKELDPDADWRCPVRLRFSQLNSTTVASKTPAKQRLAKAPSRCRAAS